MSIEQLEDNDLLPELELKEKLKRRVEDKLSPESRMKALRDHHAHRKPRPCGFTVHTGIGCSLKCIYCYIEDMGFPWSIKPYPLTGLELVYALLNNPYFIPGPSGSLIAVGSVTEPFHGATREKTFEYIEYISKYLGNPVQFSTKMYLTLRDGVRIRKADPGASPLITIVSIREYRKLEPNAPPPSKRYETIKNLRKAGLKPVLFLRPIIPGIVENEYVKLIDQAVDHGAVGVVAGSLRITEKIIERFKKIGLPYEEILRRAPKLPRGKQQVSIDTSDLKHEIAKYAVSKGLVFFPEACMANLYTHGITCWKMIHYGIAGVEQPPPKPDLSEIKRIAGELGLGVELVKDMGWLFKFKVDRSSSRKVALFSEIVKCRFKKCVRFQR